MDKKFNSMSDVFDKIEETFLARKKNVLRVVVDKKDNKKLNRKGLKEKV